MIDNVMRFILFLLFYIWKNIVHRALKILLITNVFSIKLNFYCLIEC